MNIIIAKVYMICCGVSNCYKMWRMIVYTIILVVCSSSGIQGQIRVNLTEETVVHLWAEYLELVLPDYYMIPSQNFPDTERRMVMVKIDYLRVLGVCIICQTFMEPFNIQMVLKLYSVHWNIFS